MSPNDLKSMNSTNLIKPYSDKEVSLIIILIYIELVSTNVKAKFYKLKYIT